MTSSLADPSATPPTPSVRAWFVALRPKTLPAAVVPIGVGAACAHRTGELDPATTAVALLCALLLQVASNFANDVFDFEKGADTNARVGPTRAVAAGWISPQTMKRATGLVLALAFLLGLYLVSVGGWVFLGLGVAALVCAVAYTGGPYPLGYNGLGDVCVFFFFGLVAVCGTAFLNVGHVPPVAWLAALPIGCLTTALLVVNNVRDVETDALSGKRTLVVRLGRAAGVVQYAALLGIAYLTPIVVWGLAYAEWFVLLPLLTAPLAVRRFLEVANTSGVALNATLANTAKLLVMFGALFVVGLL